ncbi:TolC family protein [Schlesneria paludicola]|uniref:TolC family protein n=1 Tax=Schlesneria paludicola TaxID=360056 RepID=UPI00029AB959|nr:TolC family protein [Schlesneria paludicola]
MLCNRSTRRSQHLARNKLDRPQFKSSVVDQTRALFAISACVTVLFVSWLHVTEAFGQDRSIPIRNLPTGQRTTSGEQSGVVNGINNAVSAESFDPAAPVEDLDSPVMRAIEAEAGIRPLTPSLMFRDAPRDLTLRNAIEISMMKSDVALTLDAGGVQISGATVYDPAIMQANSNFAATVFDPRITTGYLGSRINEPSGTFFGPGIPQYVRRDEGNFTGSLTKTWATGASTTVGYLPPLGYLFLPNGAVNQYNPIYTSDLVVQAQQPLLRGAGFAVNLAPIRIAQLRAEQSCWDFKQAMLAHVRSIETAYWDLQASLVALEAMEFVLPLMSEIVRVEGHRAEHGLSIGADVARASMQFDLLQQQRFQARNDVVGKELRLRNLIRLGLSDGTRLVPTDAPQRELAVTDHASAVATAIDNRPDLVRQRLGVRIRELEYSVARNGIRPQLDLQALYRSNGVGQGLDTALQQMVGFQYSDVTLGVTFSIPIGNRAAKSALNAAELQLMRDRIVMQQAIQNVGFALADLLRDTETILAQYDLSARRVRNSEEWIRTARVRYSNPPPAEDANPNWLLLAMYDYQNALRMHVDATTDASQLLARYNVQLARIDEAQGTLLQNRGIELDHDPCQMVRLQAHTLFGIGTSTESLAARPLPASSSRVAPTQSSESASRSMGPVNESRAVPMTPAQPGTSNLVPYPTSRYPTSASQAESAITLSGHTAFREDREQRKSTRPTNASSLRAAQTIDANLR